MPDVIVVGAGIVGLAHALAAARRGKQVLVIDRDAQANRASVRNFGFVTVTGQARERVWQLAHRSAATWRDVAAAAQIPIEQEGLLLVAQRKEAQDVVDAFLATEMGEGCIPLSAAQLHDLCPQVRDARCGLFSRHDLRVESRTAIPRLAAWLEAAHGVRFLRGVSVLHVESGQVWSSQGKHRAETILVCPGDDGNALFPEAFADAAIQRCKLQMLRLAPPGWRLPAPVMSDLSMIRYLGYSELPEAAALRRRLEHEQPQALADGIHLIAVQSADGSLVVGDSHHYAATPDPFASAAVEAEILRAYEAVLGPVPSLIERWTGTYASAASHSLVHAPADGVRLVVVTSGTGASTGFALAEDVVAELF
jgi:FAD dependent oxidoreductase TIGR03364